jgi:hypothetical protein
MHKFNTLLATALTMFMLGCASSGSAQTYAENPKFLRNPEPVLGLSADEIKAAIGTPAAVKPDACPIPIYLDADEPPITVLGTTWYYTVDIPNFSSTITICLLNDRAIGEYRTVMITKGTRIYFSTETEVDTDLVNKAYRDELDEQSDEESVPLPKYEGPGRET